MSRKFFLSCASLLLWGFFVCCSNDYFLPPVSAQHSHTHSGHAHHQETQSGACEMHGIPVHLVGIQGMPEVLEIAALPPTAFPVFLWEKSALSLVYHPFPDPDPPRQAMPHELLITTTRILV